MTAVERRGALDPDSSANAPTQQTTTTATPLKQSQATSLRVSWSPPDTSQDNPDVALRMTTGDGSRPP